jgi:hypothetical protein
VASEQILQLECPKGTDFAVQLYWTGPSGDDIDFSGPARADVRDSNGSLVLRFLDTSESPNPTLEGVLTRSSQSSVVQLTATSDVTSGLAVGRYMFDVLVTVDPTSDFPAGQLAPMVSGWFVVTPTQTQMT